MLNLKNKYTAPVRFISYYRSSVSPRNRCRPYPRLYHRSVSSNIISSRVDVCLLHTVDDRPEVKYLNRYVKQNICAAGPEVWLDLGIELLQQEDIAALKTIKCNISDCTVRCSEMFELWLERQPKASWRNLIEALKQIHQNQLAFKIEDLLSVRQTNEELEVVTVHPVLTADHSTLTQHNGMSYVCIYHGFKWLSHAHLL